MLKFIALGIVSYYFGMTTMAIFSANSYEKGFKDGKKIYND